MIAENTLESVGKQITILVIDNKPHSQHQLMMLLEPLGYRVAIGGNSTNGIDLIERYNPELMILDLIVPPANAKVAVLSHPGFDICRQVRAVSSVPIIILSNSTQPEDRVRGFEQGADDYISKPYDPAELVARIEAVLRRVNGQPVTAPEIFRCGDLEIDFAQRQVKLAGTELSLTGTEYRLLKCLAQNAGRTLVADALLMKVWGSTFDGEYASLHLYISRLRRKLGESARSSRYIITKAGVGYQFAVE